MIMQDEWFGHRSPFNGAPLGEKDEWIEWDFLLASAFQTIEVYTDDNGLYRWVKDDPSVEIQAQRKISPFDEAVDEITNAKNYKKRNGEYFIPVVLPRREDKTVWTYPEWRTAKQAEAEEDGKLE